MGAHDRTELGDTCTVKAWGSAPQADEGDAVQQVLDTAVSFAFHEGRERVCAGGTVPFSILCTASGFDVAEHAGADAGAVYDAVRSRIVHEDAAAYVLAYDGFIETACGSERALVCEVARKGDAVARLLAMPYGLGASGYRFAPAPAAAGEVPHLYASRCSPGSAGIAPSRR